MKCRHGNILRTKSVQSTRDDTTVDSVTLNAIANTHLGDQLLVSRWRGSLPTLPCHLRHQAPELFVPGDEVSLTVDLHHGPRVALDVNPDQTLGRPATSQLGGLLPTLRLCLCDQPRFSL